MVTEEASIPVCQGCVKPIKEGAVVAFGESLFHIKCFVCSKCKNRIENKSNVLLLNNDSPVCDNCSYACTVCNKMIQNEAIMADENAYHLECFKCISCKNQIKDLIFTQTKRGIYCSSCYESRKASRRTKIKPIPLSELPPRQSTEDPPTPARSRKNSSNIQNTEESLLSALSPITLSFFNSSSSDLLDNLSSSLGANLCLNFSPPAEDATQFRISRASEILQSSLRTSSLKYTPETSNRDITHLDANKLKKELSEARSNLKELESDYEVLQKASQQALDEFAKVKEEYVKEAMIKRQQEFIIATLLKTNNNGLLSKKELDKLAKFRTQLESVCNELVRYRDMLSFEIDQAMDKKTINAYYSNYQKSLKSQMSSVAQQRSMLHFETEELKATREEVIRNLIALAKARSEEQTSPASATAPSPNETVSSPKNRRISDAGSIVCRVSSRNSIVGDQIPTLFHIKKKGSTMFNKLTSSSTSINHKNNHPKLKLETSLSNTSISSTASSPSIYGMSPRYASNSSQHLSKKSGSIDTNAPIQGNHSFSAASFIRPVKCGVCTDKMWGRSEYRCDGCGFLTHSKCLSQVPQLCHSPSPVSRNSLDYLSDSSLAFNNNENKSPLQQQVSSGNTSIFGASLVDRVEFEGRRIPLLVEKCVEAVEKRGLDYEGIYRKSGGAAQTRSIQVAFDQGEKVDLCNEDEYNDICAVTSALKQYFRELPNPLLAFESYQELIDTSKMKNDSDRLEAVVKALSKLPRAHQDTLNLILAHLAKICNACSQNRMTIKNLSMVFAPTLMRHQDPSRDFLDISYKNSVVEYLLLNTAELQQHLVHHH